MSLVDIRFAHRRHLDAMCLSVGMSDEDFHIMRRWFHNSTQVFAGFLRDEVACIYGTWSASLLSDEAYLWLLTNDLVKEHPFLFVRHSQMVIERLLKDYKIIHGHVSIRHPNSIQWLEWLGVKLHRHRAEKDLIPFEFKRSA